MKAPGAVLARSVAMSGGRPALTRKQARDLLKYINRARKTLCYQCIWRMEQDLYQEIRSQDCDLQSGMTSRHGNHRDAARAEYWRPTVKLTDVWISAFAIETKDQRTAEAARKQEAARLTMRAENARRISAMTREQERRNSYRIIAGR